jgi:predicted transcriptional regulator
MYTEDATQQHLVRDLVERVFDGSAARLVMQLLSTEKASSEELAEIRRLLKKKTEGQQ